MGNRSEAAVESVAGGTRVAPFCRLLKIIYAHSLTPNTVAYKLNADPLSLINGLNTPYRKSWRVNLEP